MRQFRAGWVPFSGAVRRSSARRRPAVIPFRAALARRGRRRRRSSPGTWRPGRGCGSAAARRRATRSATARAGRGGRCALALESARGVLGRGQPAVLDQRRGAVVAAGSPVSARIAAAPTAASPGMSPSRDRPSSPRADTISASTVRSWPRMRCRSLSSSAMRRNRPSRRHQATAPSVSACAANTARHTRPLIRLPP
jgi:hypothetical protein